MIVNNIDPLICIEDCYSPVRSYPIYKGALIRTYHIYDEATTIISLSDSGPYAIYDSHNFMKLSEYRKTQIDKILT